MYISFCLILLYVYLLSRNVVIRKFHITYVTLGVFVLHGAVSPLTSKVNPTGCFQGALQGKRICPSTKSLQTILSATCQGSDADSCSWLLELDWEGLRILGYVGACVHLLCWKQSRGSSPIHPAPPLQLLSPPFPLSSPAEAEGLPQYSTGSSLGTTGQG